MEPGRPSVILVDHVESEDFEMERVDKEQQNLFEGPQMQSQED